MAPTINDLTDEAVALTALAAGLRDGTVPWTTWNEELRCPDRQAFAAEEAARAAQQAWDRLEAAEQGGPA
jgi:hypothetical protein